MSTELFLDTSIIVSRLKGEDFRKRIDELLARFRITGASSYSKTEFGNVILTRASLYLRKLRALGTLDRVMEWYAHSVRPLTHIQWAFTLLRKCFGGDSTECTERARLLLQSRLRRGTAEVNEIVDSVVDGTRCIYASAKPRKEKDGLHWPTPKCRRNAPRCAIREFFEKKRPFFDAVCGAVGQMRKNGGSPSCQLKGFEEVISAALRDPDMLFDYRNCHRLADAIIAADSEGFGSFFTQNTAESSVLCPILKQDQYYLSPNITKPIAHHGPDGQHIEEIA